MAKTTLELIAEYNARIGNRFNRVRVGSTRWDARQKHIDAIVDELSARADNGDATANAWLDQV